MTTTTTAVDTAETTGLVDRMLVDRMLLSAGHQDLGQLLTQLDCASPAEVVARFVRPDPEG